MKRTRAINPASAIMLVVACLVAGWLLAGVLNQAFAGPPDYRPPANRPPPKEQPHDITVDASTVSGATAGAFAGALAGGGAGGVGEGGAGGQVINGDTSATNSATNDGNDFHGGDNQYFSLSVGAPNIDGCMTGKSIGGGDGSGGGLLQWGSLNIPCFLNEMGGAERHIESRARLKCGAKPFRDAIAYEHPRKERQKQCIKHMTKVWQGEIDYLVELVTSTSDRRKHELDLLRLEGLLRPK